MSKSFRHVPIHGICTGSDQRDKRRANRRLRTRVKVQLHHDAEVLSVLREVSDVWTFNKDGKSYWSSTAVAARPEVMRK